MHVDTDGLRAGAGTSYNAADHTYEGAGALGRVEVSAGIFGDFAAAKSFGHKVGAAHSRHINLLDSHTTRLGTIGDKVHAAAADFADMEQRNEDRLRFVGDSV